MVPTPAARSTNAATAIPAGGNNTTHTTVASTPPTAVAINGTATLTCASTSSSRSVTSPVRRSARRRRPSRAGVSGISAPKSATRRRVRSVSAVSCESNRSEYRNAGRAIPNVRTATMAVRRVRITGRAAAETISHPDVAVRAMPAAPASPPSNPADRVRTRARHPGRSSSNCGCAREDPRAAALGAGGSTVSPDPAGPGSFVDFVGPAPRPASAVTSSRPRSDLRPRSPSAGPRTPSRRRPGQPCGDQWRRRVIDRIARQQRDRKPLASQGRQPGSVSSRDDDPRPGKLRDRGRTTAVATGSRCAVGSSSSTSGASLRMARARPSRARCPAESPNPSSPTSSPDRRNAPRSDRRVRPRAAEAISESVRSSASSRFSLIVPGKRKGRCVTRWAGGASTVPWVGSRIPASSSSSVDLPQPDGPVSVVRPMAA